MNKAVLAKKQTVKYSAHANIPNKKVSKNDISNPIGRCNYGDCRRVKEINS